MRSSSSTEAVRPRPTHRSSPVTGFLFEGNYKQIIPPYRPSFDEYFISICNVLKLRSGCLKEAVGAIIVKDKRIIATGYNGKKCSKVGTPVDSLNCFNGGCKVCNNS